VLQRVVDSLAKELDFIKAGCHIGKYITAAMNTEVEQVDIQAFRNDLDSTSIRINVSFLLLFNITVYHLILTLFLVHKII
jgi:hypothetical protein